jgi:nucleoside 2-deoxyribosyltransferase
LTFEGYKKVEELIRNRPKGDQFFVAMSFAPELNDAFDNGIYIAVDEAKYKTIRVDREQHNDKIDDKIISEIRRSSLLVADVTMHRQGVYFEAGFAMGLGIPVIWTCRDTDIDEAHFDTRQYNHIVWSNPQELKEKLLDRINALYPLVVQ